MFNVVRKKSKNQKEVTGSQSPRSEKQLKIFKWKKKKQQVELFLMLKQKAAGNTK